MLLLEATQMCIPSLILQYTIAWQNIFRYFDDEEHMFGTKMYLKRCQISSPIFLIYEYTADLFSSILHPVTTVLKWTRARLSNPLMISFGSNQNSCLIGGKLLPTLSVSCLVSLRINIYYASSAYIALLFFKRNLFFIRFFYVTYSLCIIVQHIVQISELGLVYLGS